MEKNRHCQFLRDFIAYDHDLFTTFGPLTEDTYEGRSYGDYDEYRTIDEGMLPDYDEAA